MNCYEEAFAEMCEWLGGIDPATDPEERKRLQAEIDADAFHAYDWIGRRLNSSVAISTKCRTRGY